MKRILLKSKTDETLFAQVDDEDYPLLVRHNWHALKTHGKVYAQRSLRSGGAELMHQMILGTPPQKEMVIDHINDDGLDNRKENIRFLPNSENIRRKYRDNPYTGISLKTHLIENPWLCQVSFGGKTRHIGYFPTKEAAREARDEALEELLKG